MKNFITILLLASISLTNSVLAQQNERILINGNEIHSLKLNNKVGIRKLCIPSDNFEGLEPLGIPNDTTYKQTLVNETWEFYYDDLKVTYVDTNGIPELYKIEIDGERAFIKMSGKQLTRGVLADELMKHGNSYNKNDLSVEKNSNKSIAKKFRDYSFIELILSDDGNTVEKVIYQRDLR